MDEFKAGHSDDSPIKRETNNGFVPVNRRKDAMMFRLIAERIRAGYYESTQVLKEIADRMVGTK